jgi:ribosomal protein S18 acetylase RimI-like enzyme
VVDELGIRPAEAQDLPELERQFGQRHLFAERLNRQRERRGLLLTAWRRGEVVGYVYVWLEPAEEPEIRDLHKAALISHLQVHRGHQGEGVGGELLDIAETLLCELEFEVAALGVDPTDDDLIAWYEDRGYSRLWNEPIRTTHQMFLRRGARIALPDECVVLAKPLTA